MRNFKILCGSVCSVVAALSAVSCQSLMLKGNGQGAIQVRFVSDFSDTKAGSLPDTNDFIISVTDAKGGSVFSGKFGAAPENIIASPGTYTVTAKSCEFSTPKFDAPQYGDSQVAVVRENETTVVLMNCAQINSGIKLKIDEGFLSAYPSGSLFLKSADGKLMYSYTEKRIAYFKPGSVSLMMSNGGKDQTLCTRVLEANQILSIGVSVSSSAGDGVKNGINIQIDTARNWTSEEYVIGGSQSGQGQSKNSALGVSQARAAAPAQDVWVHGYIVGGDLSSSKCSFEAPFTSKTNIVLAAKSSCTDKSVCLSVQLAKGSFRDALNLVENPELLGSQVWLKGDLVEAYYGIPGLQSISEYEVK